MPDLRERDNGVRAFRSHAKSSVTAVAPVPKTVNWTRRAIGIRVAGVSVTVKSDGL